MHRDLLWFIGVVGDEEKTEHGPDDGHEAINKLIPLVFVCVLPILDGLTHEHPPPTGESTSVVHSSRDGSLEGARQHGSN